MTHVDPPVDDRCSPTPKELVSKIRKLIKDSGLEFSEMHTYAEYSEEMPLKPLPGCQKGCEPDGFIIVFPNGDWTEIIIR